MRFAACCTPTAAGFYGRLAGGLAAAGLSLAVVGLLPWVWTSLPVVNVAAIPIGLLIGSGVRLGRRGTTTPGWPLAAAALTFLVVGLCHAYGAANLDGGHSGYVSMADFLSRLIARPDPKLLLILMLPILFGLMTIGGGFSLGVGLYAAFAVARGAPAAIDERFEAPPAPRPARGI